MKEKVQEIARRVKSLRDINGLSAESVAQKLGVPVQTYKEWETVPRIFLWGASMNWQSFFQWT